MRNIILFICLLCASACDVHNKYSNIGCDSESNCKYMLYFDGDHYLINDLPKYNDSLKLYVVYVPDLLIHKFGMTMYLSGNFKVEEY